MPNPNCPECHGTGIYRGGLHGHPEPCSLCSREIPFGDGVTIAPEFENPPIKAPQAIDQSDYMMLVRAAWRHSWGRTARTKGSSYPDGQQ